MNVLDHLAQAAAVLLLVELLVVLLLFLGVTGGLAFGLHWLRGKTDWAFGIVNGYLPLVTKYTRTGTDFAVKPVIAASVFADTAKGTVAALKMRVQTARISRAQATTYQPPSPIPPAPPTQQSVESVTTSVPIATSDIGARPVPAQDVVETTTAS